MIASSEKEYIKEKPMAIAVLQKLVNPEYK